MCCCGCREGHSFRSQVLRRYGVLYEAHRYQTAQLDVIKDSWPTGGEAAGSVAPPANRPDEEMSRSS